MPYPVAAARGKRVVTASGAPAIPRYSIQSNGTTTSIDFGSNASLDNIFTGNSVTIDFWATARESTPGVPETYSTQELLAKYESGYGTYWQIALFSFSDYELVVNISTDDTGASAMVDTTWTLDSWHHYTIAYSDAGDRKIYIAIDGVWAGVYLDQTAAVGNVLDDSVGNIMIGSQAGPILEGGIQWMRISSALRWTPGVNFVASVPVKCDPPEVDANTLELWAMDEGIGATTAASVVSPGNDGTITDGTWQLCNYTFL